MAKIGNILNWFRRKPAKPQPPTIRGHRGVRAVDLANPRLTQQIPGLPAPYAERLAGSLITPEGIEVPANEVNGFLYGGERLVVSSSNVGSAVYYPAESELLVEFLSGGTYIYSQVSAQEAMSLVTAQSKGGWVWDNLRVRGSKTAHRKPYRRAAGVRRRQPQGPIGYDVNS